MVAPLTGQARNRFAEILKAPSGIAPVSANVPGMALAAPPAAAGASPLQLANQQAYLTQALMDAQQAQPEDVGSGIVDIGNTALSGYLLNRAAGKEDARRSEAATRANAFLAQALKGQVDPAAGLSAMSDPYADPNQARLIGELLTRGPEKDPLVEVIGPDGLKHYVHESQAAGMQADYAPKPEAPIIKDFIEGGQTVQKQWDPGSNGWVEVGRGGRWQPQQAPASPERVRLAIAAGLVPGTPEYQKFLLGADQPNLQTATLYGPDGTVRTVLKSDPSFPAMLQQGWVERSPADPNSKPATEDQNKNAQLYQEILPEAPILMKNFDALGNLSNQLGGMAPDAISSYFTSPEYQQAVNALGHIISNNLYSLSGAQISDPEAQRRAKLLLPVPGESDASKANKKARIRDLYAGMRTRSGKAGADLPMPDFGDQQPTGDVPPDLLKKYPGLKPTLPKSGAPHG